MIDNPAQFDYLKVCEFDRNCQTLQANYHNTYPLTCVVRNTVKIQYSDNSTYNISFDVFNDDSPGFRALHEQSRVIAGDQIFVIQDYTKKVNGVATASITATQLVNADFQRVHQARKYETEADRQGESDDNNNPDAIVYLNLQELMSWFFDGIDSLGFNYQVHGFFPRRPMRNVGHWSGKQLLTFIEETWPGTVVIGWRHTIHLYGYQQERDKAGNLQNVRDIETGQRFDEMFDAKNVQVKRDTSHMCNAIEVKSAMYSTAPQQNDMDDADSVSNVEGSEFVLQQKPYFKPFLAVSQKSVEKYGLYASPDVLDRGFTSYDAALAAARESMIVEPVVTLTCTVDHPGQTEQQPIPGRKYTLGISQESEAYHVILRGFTWYPFDPEKGCELSFNNIDPGIIDNLRTTIIHDVQLSPQMSQFKALTDSGETTSSSSNESGEGGDTSSNSAGDSDASSTGQGSESFAGEQQMDTDASTKRPDDPGGKNTVQTGLRAFLDISDKNARAHISQLGNFTLWSGNKRFSIRVAPRDFMRKLLNHKFTSADRKNNDKFTHIFMIDFAKYKKWLGDKDHPLLRKFMHPADLYVGSTVVTQTGLIGTSAPYFTWITNLKDSDYHQNGTLKHSPDANGTFQDFKRHPGKLATIYLGKAYGHFLTKSTVSSKKNIRALDPVKALNAILHTDICTYNFKDDDDKQTYASPMIDDVHDKNESAKYSLPQIFKSQDGKHRRDEVVVGYLVASNQALYSMSKELERKHAKDVKQIKDLRKQQQNDHKLLKQLADQINNKKDQQR